MHGFGSHTYKLHQCR
ncbi:MAG: hypothetical protein ACLSCE_16615 [Bacteroides cellulosilyticus]